MGANGSSTRTTISNRVCNNVLNKATKNVTQVITTTAIQTNTIVVNFKGAVFNGGKITIRQESEQDVQAYNQLNVSSLTQQGAELTSALTNSVSESVSQSNDGLNLGAVNFAETNTAVSGVVNNNIANITQNSIKNIMSTAAIGDNTIVIDCSNTFFNNATFTVEQKSFQKVSGQNIASMVTKDLSSATTNTDLTTDFELIRDQTNTGLNLPNIMEIIMAIVLIFVLMIAFGMMKSVMKPKSTGGDDADIAGMEAELQALSGDDGPPSEPPPQAFRMGDKNKKYNKSFNSRQNMWNVAAVVLYFVFVGIAVAVTELILIPIEQHKAFTNEIDGSGAPKGAPTIAPLVTSIVGLDYGAMKGPVEPKFIYNWEPGLMKITVYCNYINLSLDDPLANLPTNNILGLDESLSTNNDWVPPKVKDSSSIVIANLNSDGTYTILNRAVVYTCSKDNSGCGAPPESFTEGTLLQINDPDLIGYANISTGFFDSALVFKINEPEQIMELTGNSEGRSTWSQVKSAYLNLNLGFDNLRVYKYVYKCIEYSDNGIHGLSDYGTLTVTKKTASEAEIDNDLVPYELTSVQSHDFEKFNVVNSGDSIAGVADDFNVETLISDILPETNERRVQYEKWITIQAENESLIESLGIGCEIKRQKNAAQRRCLWELWNAREGESKAAKDFYVPTFDPSKATETEEENRPYLYRSKIEEKFTTPLLIVKEVGTWNNFDGAEVQSNALETPEAVYVTDDLVWGDDKPKGDGSQPRPDIYAVYNTAQLDKFERALEGEPQKDEIINRKWALFVFDIVQGMPGAAVADSSFAPGSNVTTSEAKAVKDTSDDTIVSFNNILTAVKEENNDKYNLESSESDSIWRTKFWVDNSNPSATTKIEDGYKIKAYFTSNRYFNKNKEATTVDPTTPTKFIVFPSVIGKFWSQKNMCWIRYAEDIKNPGDTLGVSGCKTGVAEDNEIPKSNPENQECKSFTECTYNGTNIPVFDAANYTAEANKWRAIIYGAAAGAGALMLGLGGAFSMRNSNILKSNRSKELTGGV